MLLPLLQVIACLGTPSAACIHMRPQPRPRPLLHLLQVLTNLGISPQELFSSIQLFDMFSSAPTIVCLCCRNWPA